MAKVATITADFRAEAAQFLRELKRVNDESRRTANTIQRELSGALRTLGAVVSVGVFANFVRSSAQAADQLAKTADRLGVTTERLQALRFAARSAGADVAVLDKALFEAQKRLSEVAQTGNGAASEWIQRLNLNVRELRGLAPDQLFERYAQAVGQLNNRGDQLSAIQALMGKGAESLINVIDGGRPVLQQAAEDIKALSLELTRVDAAQIEAANDALDRMQAVSEGIGQQIAVAVAPFVEDFVNRVIEAGKQGDGLRAKIETFVRVAYGGFQIVANAARVFDAVVSGCALAIAKLGESSARIARSVVESFVGASSGPLRFGETVLATVRTLLEFTATIDRAAGVNGLADRFAGAAEEVQGLQDHLSALGKQNTAGVLGRFSDVEQFWAAMSEQAASRVQTALRGIRSFEQIGAEADRIVSDARRRAEEQAAQRAAMQAATGGGVPSEAGRTDLDRMTGILAMQLELVADMAKERDKIIGDQIDRELDRYADAADRRVEIEMQAEAAIRGQREATASYAIGLFQALGQKNKAFALAALAIEKIMTIQRILQANAIAAELAFASQLVPGDPTSLARAAAAKGAVLAQGRIQAALVALTGVVQAAQLFSDGGNAPGSATNPVFTQNAAVANTQAAGAQQGRVVNIILQGPIAGPEASRWLIDQIADAINDADALIINGDSRQAAEIRGGN